MNNNNYKFIHIGKCGGSYIRSIYDISSIHMNKPNINTNFKYIIFIRNPISRFVSAFYHSKQLIDFDLSKFNRKNKRKLLNNRDTPFYHLPNKLNNKLKYNDPFYEWRDSRSYLKLIKFFKTANILAESITSDNNLIRKNALMLMNMHTIEHIYKGIGWYLHNGEFVKKNYKNIIFIGSIENINNDIDKINKNIKLPIKKKKEYKRKNLKNYNKELSPLAIKNIINFYKNTDYKALEELNNHGFISKEQLASYYKYDNIKKNSI
jgi:hypothetical protein